MELQRLLFHLRQGNISILQLALSTVHKFLKVWQWPSTNLCLLFKSVLTKEKKVLTTAPTILLSCQKV